MADEEGAGDLRFGRITLNGTTEGDTGTFKINKAGMGWQYKDTKIMIKASDVKMVKFVQIAKFHQLFVRQKGGAAVQFDGFRGPDYESLNKIINGVWGLPFPREELSTKGWHWGEIGLNKKNIQFMVGDKKVFDVPIGNVSSATHIKDDVQLFFPPQADTTGVTPSLVELRFSFPEGGTLRGEQRDDQERADPVTEARFFHELAVAASDGGSADPMITEIQKLRVALPRGRYDLQLFPRYAKLSGATPYRVPYENVVRMHHLPSAKGDASVSFIVSMDPPIRRGQTVYNHVIMELPTDDHLNLDLALTEEQLNQYQGQLNTEMKGKTSSLVARIFKVFTGKKVTIPGGSFKSSAGNTFFPCSVGALSGNLYMLERSMFFIDKPAIMIPYDHVEQVEFLRHSQVTSNRNFDLDVKLRNNRSVLIQGRPKSNVTFSHIAREERVNLVNMFRQKDIAVKGAREERDDLNDMLGDSDEDEDEVRRPAHGVAGADEDSEHDSSFGSESASESDDLEYESKASSDSDSEGGGEEAPTKKTKVDSE